MTGFRILLMVACIAVHAMRIYAQSDTAQGTITHVAPIVDLHAALGTNLGARFGVRCGVIQPVTLELAWGVELKNMIGATPVKNVYTVMVNWHLRTPKQFVLSSGISYGDAQSGPVTYILSTSAIGWYSSTTSGVFVYPRLGFYIKKYLSGNLSPERLRYDAVLDISFGYAFF